MQKVGAISSILIENPTSSLRAKISTSTLEISAIQSRSLRLLLIDIAFVHKLGHGAFSTVWVAQDRIGNRDVALKILMLGNIDEREYRMQK
jgi:hypothetical protein